MSPVEIYLVLVAEDVGGVGVPPVFANLIHHLRLALVSSLLEFLVVILGLPTRVVCQTHLAELKSWHLEVEREFTEVFVYLVFSGNVNRTADAKFNVGDGFILFVAGVFVVGLDEEVCKGFFKGEVTEKKVEVEVLNLPCAEHVGIAFLVLVVVLDAECRYFAVVFHFAGE